MGCLRLLGMSRLKGKTVRAKGGGGRVLHPGLFTNTTPSAHIHVHYIYVTSYDICILCIHTCNIHTCK